MIKRVLERLLKSGLLKLKKKSLNLGENLKMLLKIKKSGL